MSKIVTTQDYQTSKTLSFYDLICFSLKMIVKIKFIFITSGDKAYFSMKMIEKNKFIVITSGDNESIVITSGDNNFV